jgi:peptide/nickel transport system substrate-binding protein
MPTPTHSRRRVLQTAGAVALTGGLAGCFDGEDSPTTDGPTDPPPTDDLDDPTATTDPDDGPGRDLRLVSTGYRTLDPIAATAPASVEVVSTLYQGLTTFPAGVPDPETLLAEEVVVTDAGGTYRIALDSDARFHDPVGREVRAADVVYSFERLAASPHSAHRGLLLDDLGVVHERDGTAEGTSTGTPTDSTADDDTATSTADDDTATSTADDDTATSTPDDDTTSTSAGDGDTGGQYVTGTLGVEAVGERTVELELADPHHAVESILAHPAFSVLPAGLVGDVPGHEGTLDYETFATRSPVGTGPFRFDGDTPDGEYRVAAREAPHTGTPGVAGIRWTRVPDAQTGYERAIDGDADVFGIPDSEYDPDDATVVRIDDRGRKTGTYGSVDSVGEPLAYQQVCRLATGYVGLNPTRVPKPVRRAVAYALDPTALATDVHRGRATPAVHLTPPALFPGGRDAALDHGESYPFDVGASRVDAARRTLSAGGYGPANAVDLRFTTDGSDTAVRTAGRLRRALGDLAVNVFVETVTPTTLRRRRQSGDLDLFWASHEFDTATVDEPLRLLAPGTGPGVVGWDASDADAGSADRAREAWRAFKRHQRATEEHRQVRAEAVRDVEAANWQDVVCLPVVHPLCEVVSYDYVDLPATGATGFVRRTLADVRVGPRD